MVLADIVSESAAGVIGQRAASLAVVVAMAIAAATFVAISSVAGILASQVSDLFDERLATTITADSDDVALCGDGRGLESVRLLPGVTGAGCLGDRVETEAMVRFTTIGVPVGARVATADALSVLEPHFVAGRGYSHAHESLGSPVAVIPASLADAIGVSAVGQEIRIGDERVRVVGVFDDLVRRIDVIGDVLVSRSGDPELTRNEAVIVSVRSGWGPRVAPAIPLALRPGAPDRVSVSSPLDPRDFRLSIEGSVRTTGYVTSLLAAVVGAVVLANVTATGVVARYAELGVRRAFGSPRLAVAAELVLQTVLLSLAGAALGVAAGAGIIAGWSTAYDHPFAIDLGGLGLVWLGALGVGLVAGLAPATTALRIPPVTALRA